MDEWQDDLGADLFSLPGDSTQPPLGRSGRLVSAARLVTALVVRGWLHAYHRLTIVGRHNLPTGRAFILIANHCSHLDTLCLLAALPLARLRHAFPATAKDYFCVSAPRALLARVLVNALPFERHFFPWESLRRCGQLLQDRDTILIFFPEGTRRGGEVGPFKPGVALLAAGRDLPVVPCHLAGTHKALPKGAWLPRPQALRLTIGAPRTYAHWPATKESARQISAELREDVLLLGQQRGQAAPASALPVSLFSQEDR
jgi:1-acyl-sn-glycerol-3-phosphate acyltransferase